MTVFGERYLALLKEYADLERTVKELEKEKKETREKIMNAMDENGIKSFENELLKMTIVAPSVSTTIDTSALRMNDPDTYDKLIEVYPKTTERRQSLRVTLR